MGVRYWLVFLSGVALVIGAAWIVLNDGGDLRGQSRAENVRPSSRVFSPAHSSVEEAARHFFGIRPEPQQPIAYSHKVHIEIAGLSCEQCHAGVVRGPVAHLPSIFFCMSCHEEVATESPDIQTLTGYFNKGQEVPWRRVYGFTDEAHVRFNHAPHVRANVDCATCHGDVAQMSVARRVVDHTMGFCVSCHKQNQASVDCLTCHY